MSVKITQKTATVCGYGEYFPAVHQDGDKRDVLIFLHGIGEILSKKTLEQAVAFHAFFQKVADFTGMIIILPQDDGTSLFDDKEVVQIMPHVRTYAKRIYLGGLSRGAGTSLSIKCSRTSSVKQYISGYLFICPPTWEGMDEVGFAMDDTPSWWIHGAKDQADPATYISRAANTVDDFRRAGAKNFYFSIFPSDDHYIWIEVLTALGYPPVSPINGAASWSGKNTVNGQTVDITVQCVNNPALDVYSFLRLQTKGQPYKPMPLLSDGPMPVPPPIPAPTPSTMKYFKNFYQSGPRIYQIVWKDDAGNETKETWKIAADDEMKEQYTNNNADGRQYLKVVTVKGVVKVFNRK